MFKQALILLLFPLALAAQQPQANLQLSRASLFIADDADLSLPFRADYGSDRSALPNAPEPPDALSFREASPLTGVYEPSRVTAPEAPARRTVWNKKLIVAHAVFLGSIVYDAELTHQGLAHHNCEEGNASLGTHPSRGELYRKNMLSFGAISGIDWFTNKTKMRYLPYLGPVVGSAVHLVGGSKWLAECW
jgi:hypothetical protein